jgi:uncharacterized protein YacL
MISIATKLFIIVLGGVIGFVFPPFSAEPAVGFVIGAVIAAVLAIALALFERGTPGMIIGGIAGFAISVWLAGMLNSLIFSGIAPSTVSELRSVITYVVSLVVVGSGTMFGILKGRWLTPHNIRAALSLEDVYKSYKILDTSVIIDGRIADIVETGFLGGILVVPHFILKELQQIADSSQSLKRNRGRRGLDVLQKIKKMNNVQVIFPEQDFPEVPEVDLKLIELARLLGGKIVTNDFNLNKVAQLRGVEVLNINELANALKPVVLPGELMQVFVLKEGKEPSQGIGYLDDGTMIVVDNSSHLIGQTIELVVTSVLQTTAGKMIFGKTENGKAAHLASTAS